MTTQSTTEALDSAQNAISRLHRMCCDPGRSPRMLALEEQVAAIRAAVPAATGDEQATAALIESLEEAGARIGRLQIGCCAPARMPLYAQLLTDLTTIQLDLHRAVGQAHM